MDKFINILRWVLIAVLGLWGVTAIVLLFAGGNQEVGLEVAGEFLDIPNYTDLFLYTNYVYFALTLIASLVLAGVGMFLNFKKDWKRALAGIGSVVLIACLFLVCWTLGSPEKLEIIGYEGTDNQGFWAQFSDMMMYATYLLVAGVLLSICFYGVMALVNRIKK